MVKLISQRVGRCLERLGSLEQDAENAWLDLDPAEDNDAMPQILGSSVCYRIAVDPQQGRKVFMIRTIRPLDRPDPGPVRVAKKKRVLPACWGELQRAPERQAGTVMPVHRPLVTRNAEITLPHRFRCSS